MVEVQSQKNEGDQYRMLLQAACVVKFANAFVKKYEQQRDFFLVAVYVTRFAEAHRMIFFQDRHEGRIVRGVPSPNNKT